jgi:hypothetical protein
MFSSAATRDQDFHQFTFVLKEPLIKPQSSGESVACQ